ncbi:glycosyltransferase [Cyanobacterium aponinum UTEX 3222]|uniref:glycosyltransferase n=1 Tax=Cyanobacterium aponinum TaxID=379064 RepID=UPI00308CB1D5|nr:glycosyltransferase [Cyanobacterium aponinum UTEX 3222]
METVKDIGMSRNIKVMFFLPSLGGGGAEVNAIRVALNLQKYGIFPSFAVCRGQGNYEKLLPKEIPVHILDTGSIKSSTLQLLKSRKPLQKLIEKEQPDVICPVMYGSSLIVLSIINQLKISKKYIVAINIQNSPKAKFIRKKSLYSLIVLTLMKKLYTKADVIISLSKGVAQELVEIVPDIKSKITIIPNASNPIVENTLQATVEIKKPPEGKLIVACGRLVEQKGYPYLLRAFAKVLKTENAYLWILGEGKLRTSLEQMCQSLKIEDRVNFFGFRNNPQAYMAQGDVFVLSSLWEGFGNVIVEAMEVGTPVISTNCPHGPAEIIEDGISGILVSPGSEEELAEAMIKLLRDDNLRLSLSSAGRVRALDFSPSLIASKYASVFRLILTNKLEKL